MKLGMALQKTLFDPPPLPRTPGFGGPLPEQLPGLGGMGATPAKPKGLWNGGKASGKDILGLILGALGDGLAINDGRAPLVAPMLLGRLKGLKDTEAEEVAAQRKRLAEREDKQWEWANKPKEASIPPFVRDYQAWQQMSPEERAGVGEMEEARSGDRFVTTVLPDGRFYAGPQRGLVDALTGSGQPAAPKAAPRGKLRPMGGGSGNATGGFR